MHAHGYHIPQEDEEGTRRRRRGDDDIISIEDGTEEDEKLVEEAEVCSCAGLVCRYPLAQALASAL